jgi:hypothetical protein
MTMIRTLRTFLRRRLRAECAMLLRSGEFVEIDRRPGVARYLHVGRWLVREDRVRTFVRSPHCRWRDFVRATWRYFEPNETTAQTQLLLLQELVRPKLSMFALDDGTKDVRFHHRVDYETETAALEEFSARGVCTPPIVLREPARHRYLQRLVCDPLFPPARRSNVDLGAFLLTLSRNANVTFVPVERYLEQHGALLQARRPRLEPKLSAALARATVLVGESRLFAARGIPHARCHGDFSLNNVLMSSDGLVYFNDFDRSFEANLFYDVLYCHINTSLPLATAVATLSELGRRAGVDHADTTLLFRVALNLFLLDLHGYVTTRYVTLGDDQDRACAHSLDVLLRAAVR